MKVRKKARIAKRKALEEWTMLVKQSGRCQICGHDKFLDAHHILPKERWSEYRTKLINGICLCKNCHKFGTFSAHRHGIWFGNWLREHYPEQYEWALSAVKGNSEIQTKDEPINDSKGIGIDPIGEIK